MTSRTTMSINDERKWGAHVRLILVIRRLPKEPMDSMIWESFGGQADGMGLCDEPFWKLFINREAEDFVMLGLVNIYLVYRLRNVGSAAHYKNMRIV